MMLYAKEMTSNDRVNNAIRRISGNGGQQLPAGNVEQTILTWVSHTCAALKKRIERDMQTALDEENVSFLVSKFLFLEICCYCCFLFLRANVYRAWIFHQCVTFRICAMAFVWLC